MFTPLIDRDPESGQRGSQRASVEAACSAANDLSEFFLPRGIHYVGTVFAVCLLGVFVGQGAGGIFR